MRRSLEKITELTCLVTKTTLYESKATILAGDVTAA
jgi:hypothetical protein